MYNEHEQENIDVVEELVLNEENAPPPKIHTFSGHKSSGWQAVWATANSATHCGQLGDRSIETSWTMQQSCGFN